MTFTTEQHVRKPWGWFACKMNKNTIKADDWDPLIHIMLMFRWHNIFNRTHFSVGLKAIDFFFIWSGFHGTYQTTRKKYCFYDILGSTWPLGKFATFPCGVTNQLAWEILVCFNSYMVRHGIFELSCGYDIFTIMFFSYSCVIGSCEQRGPNDLIAFQSMSFSKKSPMLIRFNKSQWMVRKVDVQPRNPSLCSKKTYLGSYYLKEKEHCRSFSYHFSLKIH
jgi:hypothetical protein